MTTTDPQAAFGAVVVESRTDRPNIAKTALQARARGSADPGMPGDANKADAGGGDDEEVLIVMDENDVDDF